MVDTLIKIENVQRGAQVEWRTDSGGPSGEENDRVEAYAGNVVVDYHAPESGDQDEFSFLTYLPTRAAVIRTYGDTSEAAAPLFKATILVTPIGINGHDSEWIVAVNDWQLQMLPQVFSVLPSKAFYCLILRFQLAVKNSVVIRVGYQVTITTPASVDVGELPLDPTDAPHSAPNP
jgi:hypothetical protein